jgi:hypothetical protein
VETQPPSSESVQSSETRTAEPVFIGLGAIYGRLMPVRCRGAAWSAAMGVQSYPGKTNLAPKGATDSGVQRTNEAIQRVSASTRRITPPDSRMRHPSKNHRLCVQVHPNAARMQAAEALDAGRTARRAVGSSAAIVCAGHGGRRNVRWGPGGAEPRHQASQTSVLCRNPPRLPDGQQQPGSILLSLSPGSRASTIVGDHRARCFNGTTAKSTSVGMGTLWVK